MDIEEFFQFNRNNSDFIDAITPKACNGSERFKVLALYGDKILDLILVEEIDKSSKFATGEITQQLGSLVNKRTLLAVGKYFKLPEFIHEHNKCKVRSNDIKEGVEALIGAHYKTYGFKATKQLIIRLLQLINNLQLNDTIIDKNPKGELLEFFQHQIAINLANTSLYSMPSFLTRRVGGEDHEPEFLTTIEYKINGKIDTIDGKIKHSKQEAERSAANILLNKISLVL